MSEELLPKRLILPGEEYVDREMVRTVPLHIVARFLESFDSAGEQIHQVPRHVLEELARRFQRVMTGEVKTLERAFGGGVARQRQYLETDATEYRVLWHVHNEYAASKQLSPFERSGSKPLEHAFQNAANRTNMSASNVERIWKKSKKAKQPGKRTQPAKR